MASLAMNRLYCCPSCGNTWKVRVGPGEWLPIRRACSACPPWPSAETSTSWPGSSIDWREGWEAVGHDPFTGLAREDLAWELYLLDRALTMGHVPGYDCPNLEAKMTELTARISELRAKVVSGAATDADIREALRLMREERSSAAYASAKSRAKKSAAAGPAVDATALTNAFGL